MPAGMQYIGIAKHFLWYSIERGAVPDFKVRIVDGGAFANSTTDPALVDFLADKPDILNAGSFGDVDDPDNIAVWKIGAGSDEHVLIGARAVDFAQP